MKKILTLALCLVASTAVFAQTQVIAHRGFHATQNSVRNSLSALKHAQDLGAYGSECDINETKDGVLVVVHGPMHGEYRVQETDYATLRAKALENGEVSQSPPRRTMPWQPTAAISAPSPYPQSFSSPSLSCFLSSTVQIILSIR